MALKFRIVICLIASSLILSAAKLYAAKPRVLIFSKTAGYHHMSIGPGTIAIQKLGAEHSFDVDTTTDASKFILDSLKKYAAVIFLNTTGDVLNDAQQAAFEQYIKLGRGFVGVHAATDTEYSWPWYGNLVGAYFKSHPSQQEAIFHVVDHKFIATKHLPDEWKRFDELYNFKWFAPDLHVLITIDEKTYKGGENGDNHPMSWYHNYDGGRAFYTALGHTDASYQDPLFLKHLLGGILYAVGKAK